MGDYHRLPGDPSLPPGVSAAAVERHASSEPTHYRCLICGRTCERDDPADLPRGDEHCDHEWDETDGPREELYD